MRAKYQEENQKRREVSRGWAQYRRVEDLAKSDPRFAKLAADPFIDYPGMTHLGVKYPAARAGRPLRATPGPKTDEVGYTIVGGGYAGILAAGRLRMADIPASEIRVVEVGGDVGGTWYWNRYPGAMCDVESYVYMPFCEELNYVPVEKYCHQPEMMRHSQMIAEKYGLYEKIVLGTHV